MKFLTFVKEYVQEHPHLSFKEAIRSDEVKCLYHKAGKATYCKDDENKGVVVNVNCSGKEEEEDKPSKKLSSSIQQSYTAPRPPPPPRGYDAPGYADMPPEQPRPPMPPRRQPIKQEAPLREEEAPLREQEFYDNDWDSLSALEQELADYEDATTFPESFAGESYAGSTVVPERRYNYADDDTVVPDADAMSMFSRLEDERLQQEYENIPPPPGFIPPPPMRPPLRRGPERVQMDDDYSTAVSQPDDGPPGVNVVEQEVKQEGAGIGKRKPTAKSILKSYTAPRHVPGPRQYVPPRPEFRRQTNDKDREAILKIIDAVRLILN